MYRYSYSTEYSKRAALSVAPGFCVYTDKRLIPSPPTFLGFYVLGYGNTVFTLENAKKVVAFSKYISEISQPRSRKVDRGSSPAGGQ